MTVLLLLPFVVAGVWMLAARGGVVTPSADEGAESLHVGWLWLAAAGLGLIAWVTSRGVDRSDVTERNRRQVSVELLVLLGCALGFPLVMALPFWHPLDYVWLKPLVLLVVPVIALALFARRFGGRSLRVGKPRVSVLMVLGVLAGIAVYFYVTNLSPAAPAPGVWPDRATLIVGATVTALTASIGEEIFYRYWLQTRLEARFGRWPGILAASLVFALMHLASHGAGDDPVTRFASVIAVQGVFGVAAGFLWSRYRRLWMPIVLHLVVNGLLVVLYLLGLWP